ncbi:hypothetical protein LCGC14_3003220, partial [marine sediment metagenome]
IDDVGPGGVVSRTAQLAQDLFLPIGIGGLAVGAGRRIPGGEDIIQKGEETIGVGGLGLQATGFNVRAINVKKQVVERTIANLGGFDQDELDAKMKQAVDDEASPSRIAEIQAGDYLHDITSVRRDIGLAVRYLSEEDIEKLAPIATNYVDFKEQKDEYGDLSDKEQEQYIERNPIFTTNRLFWGEITTFPDFPTAKDVAARAEKYDIPLDMIPAFQLTDSGKERIPSERELWKPYFDYYDLPGTSYLNMTQGQVDAGLLPEKYRKEWETYNKLKTDTARGLYRRTHKQAAYSKWRTDFRRANPEFNQWLIDQGYNKPLKRKTARRTTRRRTGGIRVASSGIRGGTRRPTRAITVPSFRRPRVSR